LKNREIEDAHLQIENTFIENTYSYIIN